MRKAILTRKLITTAILMNEILFTPYQAFQKCFTYSSNIQKHKEVDIVSVLETRKIVSKSVSNFPNI